LYYEILITAIKNSKKKKKDNMSDEQDNELYRELGEVEQRLKKLEEGFLSNSSKLDELLVMKRQMEGGRKAVVFLVIIASTCGAAVTWVAQHITWS
jgi:hypothetical protein